MRIVVGVFLASFLALLGVEHARGEGPTPGAGTPPPAVERKARSREIGYELRRSLSGPNSVDRTLVRNDTVLSARLDVGLRRTLRPWFDLKRGLLRRYGLRFGADYQALAMTFDETSLGRSAGASGNLRIFGDWTLVNRCSGRDTGTIEFRFENRHPYTSVTPSALGPQAGYGGNVGVTFSDSDGFVVTSLHWVQKLGGDRTQVQIGLLDQTDLFDLHHLSNPYTAFQNLAHILNPSQSIPDQGLGVVVTHWFDAHWHGLAGIHDANAVLGRDGFDTLFGDFETFKYAELGWARSREERLTHKVNIALWQQDEREKAGVDESWGLGLTGTWGVGRYQPFLRAGWSDGPAALARWHVGAGVGCQGLCKSELLGLGLAVDDVNGALRDEPQWTAEAFYRFQVTDFLQVTPSVQLLAYPAFDAQDDLLVLFGLRLRYAW